MTSYVDRAMPKNLNYCLKADDSDSDDIQNTTYRNWSYNTGDGTLNTRMILSGLAGTAISLAKITPLFRNKLTYSFAFVCQVIVILDLLDKKIKKSKIVHEECQKLSAVADSLGGRDDRVYIHYYPIDKDFANRLKTALQRLKLANRFDFIPLPEEFKQRLSRYSDTLFTYAAYACPYCMLLFKNN